MNVQPRCGAKRNCKRRTRIEKAIGRSLSGGKSGCSYRGKAEIHALGKLSYDEKDDGERGEEEAL